MPPTGELDLIKDNKIKELESQILVLTQRMKEWHKKNF